MLLLLTSILFAGDMDPKSALAKFRRRILKRPYEGDGSNSPVSVGSKDLKFISTPDSSTPKVHALKK